MTEIKSIVREVSDEQLCVIRAIENDQREDLNPIEKAKIYYRLKEKLGWGSEKIAQRMGRSPVTVRNYLGLLNLAPEWQTEVAMKRLAMAVALCLNEIDDEDFRNYYFKAAVQNGVTFDVARTWVDSYRKTKVGAPQSGMGGEGVVSPDATSAPVYNTCFVCLGPVEVNKVRYVPVCPDCCGRIKAALVSDK
jgi:ParB family chromosome partitioning protein